MLRLLIIANLAFFMTSHTFAATIYFNANIFTFDDEAISLPTALRVDNGIITHVYANGIPEDAEGERIDLMGRTVLPGLVDAHLHLEWLGSSKRTLNLSELSREDIVKELQVMVKGRPEDEWIIGNGWNENQWPDARMPSKEDIDLVTPHHPVWFTRADGHAVWLNSKALELVGINTYTPNPPGGIIERNEKDQPSGILIDAAVELAQKTLPPPSFQQLKSDLLQAVTICAQMGLTGVHDMGATPNSVEALRQLEREGRLPIRVTNYIRGEPEAIKPLLTEEQDPKGLVIVAGQKLFLDGALGSHGAWLKTPYADKQDHYGLTLMSPEALYKQVSELHQMGRQAAIHAIGDQANQVALQTIARVQQEHPMPIQHRIEHAQLVAPEDISLFTEHNVIASMQPIHCTSDMSWVVSRLGEQRLIGAYAWASLLTHGTTLAFGSDAPVENVNPWWGIYAAITRQDHFHNPKEGFMPDEKLTPAEALVAYTTGAAKAWNAEDRLGKIKEGYFADLTILENNPFLLTADELLRTKPTMTIVNGVLHELQ